ncbi:MAG: tRNA pseudouridine(55) synthase TruB [Solirubrobacterales bacterium]
MAPADEPAPVNALADGVLLVDKPAGVTSHDVVARIRRERGGKVGHAGTLDPFATGLLLVLLGRATRLQRFLMDLAKTYRAVARLGWTSSTGDRDGELTETSRIPERLELPVGQVTQRLPMTSAVHVDGERLYKKAHRGEVVETPTRTVTVHRAELIDACPERVTFEIDCASGTYIRTLVETLGNAYCEELRRTAIGPFSVEQAGTELAPAEALSFLPDRPVDDEEAVAVGHGKRIPIGDALEPGDRGGPFRLTHGSRLVAVAEDRDGQAKTLVVFS